MIVIGKVAVSDELTEEMFACDLSRCKGACCVEGDGGAPLEDDEIDTLGEIYEDIKPYLNDAGRKVLAEEGLWTDEHGYPGTPLVNDRECAYAIFAPDGTALCGIEQAWADGKTHFRKPISCQLYPIRIGRMGEFETLNYHRWDICSPACARGASTGVRVYEFLQESLTRKYGAEFYATLDGLVKAQRGE